ncbi:MAG TPA: helix-turn-helix transcriptional regulator [Gemmatimonadaceae bacterium]|nr:helix-turn-helix transcriptional regulator [Gemmatimonadaceae bacterium]
MGRQLGYATVAVLRAMAAGARYGLDIIEATGLPSGTVYPALASSEKRGYVTGTWESAAIATRDGRPRRRYYRLTSAGKTALAEAIRYYAPLAADGWPGDAVPEGR